MSNITLCWERSVRHRQLWHQKFCSWMLAAVQFQFPRLDIRHLDIKTFHYYLVMLCWISLYIPFLEHPIDISPEVTHLGY